MKLRIFPREDSYFDLFESAADNVAVAAELLLDRLYRQARADLYAFETEHPARYVLIWKDIIEQLEDALDGLQKVARTVESITLKYA